MLIKDILTLRSPDGLSKQATTPEIGLLIIGTWYVADIVDLF